jgi:hypothetical protein
MVGGQAMPAGAAGVLNAFYALCHHRKNERRKRLNGRPGKR